MVFGRVATNAVVVVARKVTSVDPIRRIYYHRHLLLPCRHWKNQKKEQNVATKSDNRRILVTSVAAVTKGTRKCKYLCVSKGTVQSGGAGASRSGGSGVPWGKIFVLTRMRRCFMRTLLFLALDRTGTIPTYPMKLKCKFHSFLKSTSS